MKFTPKTEEQLKEEMLLPDGDYDFEVIDAKDKQSKKGNDMIEVKLNVWGPGGSTHHIYDYLLEQMMFKLLHFCESVGLQKEYQFGTLDAQSCLRKSGKVRISITDAKNGYPAKNTVDDYIVPEGGKKMERPMKAPGKKAEPAPEELDVPF